MPATGTQDGNNNNNNNNNNTNRKLSDTNNGLHSHNSRNTFINSKIVRQERRRDILIRWLV